MHRLLPTLLFSDAKMVAQTRGLTVVENEVIEDKNGVGTTFRCVTEEKGRRGWEPQRPYAEDQLLVLEAQDGDVRAMEALVRRWQKRLWQHALRLTDDPEAAWDVTQQTCWGSSRGCGG